MKMSATEARKLRDKIYELDYTDNVLELIRNAAIAGDVSITVRPKLMTKLTKQTLLDLGYGVICLQGNYMVTW